MFNLLTSVSKIGNPLDTDNMMGAQCSLNQKEKIMEYINIGKEEGAELLIGGDVYESSVNPNGFYIQPTLFKGHDKVEHFPRRDFWTSSCSNYI